MRRAFTSLVLMAAFLTPIAATVACAKKQPPVLVQGPPIPPPPVAVRNDPPPPPPPPPPTPPAPVPPPPPTPEEIWTRMTLAELVAARPFDDAFFDLDKAELSDAARVIMQKNADYMKKWTSVRIQIEGHADSRGTNEYNLALGERRASAARDYLASLGIDAARIAMVSKGEEQPFCMEETESCFAQNRRAHVVIIAK